MRKYDGEKLNSYASYRYPFNNLVNVPENKFRFSLRISNRIGQLELLANLLGVFFLELRPYQE